MEFRTAPSTRPKFKLTYYRFFGPALQRQRNAEVDGQFAAL
jgi:hypothetical protein